MNECKCLVPTYTVNFISRAVRALVDIPLVDSRLPVQSRVKACCLFKGGQQYAGIFAFWKQGLMRFHQTLCALLKNEVLGSRDSLGTGSHCCGYTIPGRQTGMSPWCCGALCGGTGPCRAIWALCTEKRGTAWAQPQQCLLSLPHCPRLMAW